MKAIILFLFLFLSVSSYSQNLFTENQESKNMEVVDRFLSTKYYKNFYTGQVDLSVLESDVVYLQIPERRNIEFHKSEQSEGANVWIGNSDNGNLIIVWDEDEYLGTITDDLNTYQISSVDKEHGIICELDHSKYPPELCPDHENEEHEHENEEQPADSEATNGLESDETSGIGESRSALNGEYDCNLRVLVAYTSAVQNSTNVRNLANLAIHETNVSYANSQINHRVELAALIPVNYTESSFSTDLDRFKKTSDGYMDEIHTYRDLYNADVCVLLINNSTSCGLASQIGSTKTTAFCAVHWDCATGNYSFAHEIGHLQSARHDTYVDNTTTPYAYGHGYVSPNNNWRTIMAYADACGSCTRLQFWSNPNVNHPIDGLPMGNASTADNARVLNQTTPTLRAFYQPPTALTVNSSAVGNSRYVDAIAKDSIVTSGTVTVSSGQQVDMRAGTRIVLKPGFHATSGSSFNARITNIYDCGGSSKSISTDVINELVASNEAEQAEWGQNVELSVSVYPNPVSNILNIEYNMPERDWLKITILDAQGRVLKVYEEPRVKERGFYSATLSLDELISGLYFVRVTLPNSQKSKIARIIVQK